MELKPRKEYVIVKTMGLSGKAAYLMDRRYRYEGLRKQVWSLGILTNGGQNKPYETDYVATGLSYKQAKKMMKLFKEQ